MQQLWDECAFWFDHRCAGILDGSASLFSYMPEIFRDALAAVCAEIGNDKIYMMSIFDLS